MGLKFFMARKILVVDDEPDQLQLVGEILMEEGFATDRAINGVDALKKIAHSLPDLVVVDAAMPYMNGFTLCENLRKNPATANIPIIMLTGLCSSFARLNGLAHGANIYMTKPFMSDDLVAKINELLTAKE